MKLLVIGDPHFKKDNTLTMTKVSNEILAIATARKPELIVCLGDVLDTHEKIHLEPFSQAVNFLERLADLAPLILLVGNHDRLNNSDFCSDRSPFLGFRHHPRITLVDLPVWKGDFIYVPYVPNGRFLEALNMIGYDPSNASKHPKCIFAHQEFRGAKMGAIESKDGDFWDSSWPQVISGHIHDHQIINNVYYVGTPVQHNYGESANKAVLWYDSIGDELERIPLTSVPLKRIVHLWMEDLNDFQKKLPEGFSIRVILHVQPTEELAVKKDPRYQALSMMVDKIKVKPDVEPKEGLEATVHTLVKKNELSLTRLMLDLLEDEETRRIFQEEIVT